jgi:hypothetical protein
MMLDKDRIWNYLQPGVKTNYYCHYGTVTEKQNIKKKEVHERKYNHGK